MKFDLYFGIPFLVLFVTCCMWYVSHNEKDKINYKVYIDDECIGEHNLRYKAIEQYNRIWPTYNCTVQIKERHHTEWYPMIWKLNCVVI